MVVVMMIMMMVMHMMELVVAVMMTGLLVKIMLTMTFTVKMTVLRCALCVFNGVKNYDKRHFSLTLPKRQEKLNENMKLLHNNNQ